MHFAITVRPQMLSYRGVENSPMPAGRDEELNAAPKLVPRRTSAATMGGLGETLGTPLGRSPRGGHDPFPIRAGDDTKLI